MIICLILRACFAAALNLASVHLNHIILIKSGTTETNPRPKNLHGIVAHDFVKMPLVETYIIAQHVDIVCLNQS